MTKNNPNDKTNLNGPIKIPMTIKSQNSQQPKIRTKNLMGKNIIKHRKKSQWPKNAMTINPNNSNSQKNNPKNPN